MSNSCPVLKAVEFIEAHLTDAITIADMAEAASFSLFHFSRTFSRIMRHTPYDYLMRRRLSEAARCLLETDEKIIDVAFKYQFNAPETFSRAFKRMFNLQPRQAKLQQGPDQRQLFAKPTPEYIEFLRRAGNLTPTLKKIPSTRIAGIAAPIDNIATAQNTIAALWQSLWQAICSEAVLPPPPNYYGILMFLPDCSASRCLYLAGMPVPENEEAPPFFVQKNIPHMEYVCFTLPEQANAAAFTRNYMYHTWWPKAAALPPGPFEIEVYAKFPAYGTKPADLPNPRLLCFPIVPSP